MLGGGDHNTEFTYTNAVIHVNFTFNRSRWMRHRFSSTVCACPCRSVSDEMSIQFTFYAVRYPLSPVNLHVNLLECNRNMPNNVYFFYPSAIVWLFLRLASVRLYYPSTSERMFNRKVVEDEYGCFPRVRYEPLKKNHQLNHHQKNYSKSLHSDSVKEDIFIV